MGKLKQSLIDTDIDLSDQQRHTIMWNEKTDLYDTTEATARQYAENAVLAVALIILLIIGVEYFDATPKEEKKVTPTTVQKVSAPISGTGNTYLNTYFRYSGTIPHIDKLHTERI